MGEQIDEDLGLLAGQWASERPSTEVVDKGLGAGGVTGGDITGEECLPDAIDQDVAGENHELFHLDDADVAKPAPAAASSSVGANDGHCADEEVSDVEEEVENEIMAEGLGCSTRLNRELGSGRTSRSWCREREAK